MGRFMLVPFNLENVELSTIFAEFLCLLIFLRIPKLTNVLRSLKSAEHNGVIEPWPFKMLYPPPGPTYTKVKAAKFIVNGRQGS